MSDYPTDEYTPHGYLANPYAVAHSWSEGEGGCLRSSREGVGFGWLLPWTLRWKANVELLVVLQRGDETLASRADFDAHGLHASHHSALLFTYHWQAFGRVWTASYTLIDRDQLGLEVGWEPDGTEEIRDVSLIFLMRGAHRSAATDGRTPIELGSTPDDGDIVGTLTMPDPFGAYELEVSGLTPWTYLAPDDLSVVPTRLSEPGNVEVVAGRVGASILIGTQRSVTGCALLRHQETPSEKGRATPVGLFLSRARERVREGEGRVKAAVQTAWDTDKAFWSKAARLEGDWPPSWRRGWTYDLETTRMCIYPPGGIFADVWPAWMVQWPRAVVAEGTLDCVRLAYADPDLAKRAALSLFRDATAPNVPCVFQYGEPNMVARDGAICGTSPAWCVPFFNLERLYALTLDRGWLAAIYPFLARYVEWWLAERTDRDGWAVYKCTWEAGEDDTPRLDPERRGDNVVSSFVRPVELQATMALSAGVLARFAAVLGRDDDVNRWRAVEADFARRTQTLWDQSEGRFRDWDARRGVFLAPSTERNYWGVDPCRFSALAFTPLLAGIATPEQARRLHAELRHYARPPWTRWASWSYVVLEGALVAGARTFAADVANDIVSRVYPELDARQIASPRHPTPGVAREYWPLDLSTWESCEGYGWGANTASLLIRQIFGFLEGPHRATDVDGRDTGNPAGGHALHFRLWPSLPAAFCTSGKIYRVSNLPYRGRLLTLSYRIAAPPTAASGATLTISIAADVPARCQITAPDGSVIVSADRPALLHEFSGTNGLAYDVVIEP